MKGRPVTAILVWSTMAAALVSTAYGQSLTDKLEEEETFYQNYGKEPYAKLKMEKDVVGHYDEFGEHIVDGVHLYRLHNEAQNLENSDVDSVEYSRSTEYQKNDFYEKFSNLVVTQDAIGGVKTSFLVGDQITTKFTPLTFNKTNFKGIRWDWWSSGLKFTALLSRTRPGYTATMKDDGEGAAYIAYPIDEGAFPPMYYEQGIKGNLDYSNKSPYGDYDFLWALHGQNTIANKIDVGITAMNHYSNDVKKGPGILKGDLPDSLMPNYIHFEFYDNTPSDTLDAGVFVDYVRMYVNNKPVQAAPAFRDEFMRAFVGDRDGILLPRDLPLARPQNGPIPVMVEFSVDPKYWNFVDGQSHGVYSIKDIKTLTFKYAVAGNYTAYVSTDRQIPPAIYGQPNPQTREVEYSYPTRSVGEIYDAGLTVDAGGQGIAYREENYSTTYYGEYISQSPKKISRRASEFEQRVAAANSAPGSAPSVLAGFVYREHTYSYNLNVSSLTLGLDFRGEIAGVKFSGEVAYNRSEDMLPGAGDEGRETTNKFAGVLRAERAIGKSLGINGEAYYLSPDWNSSMSSLYSSNYFSQTQYKDVQTNPETGLGYLYDYQVHPGVLDRGNGFVDDNDDGDGFVDNEPRRYPSDLDADGERDMFLNDGTLDATWSEMERVVLPTGLVVPYDDPDGVVASKNDRNLNGEPDYEEDFLLYASDPPVFDLGIDLNNNGVPDYEDDDILPDFFSEVGRSVGAVVVGDGIKTLGIQGVKLNLRWTPMENTPIDAGVIFEGVVDRDFDVSDEAPEDNVDGIIDGRSLVVYLTAKREVLKRSQGLQYEFGNELRYVRDAIRNDVITSDIQRVGEEIDPSYYYRTDPLDYRNAIIDNLMGGLTYTNIRDFEYNIRAKVGVEYHIGIDDEVYSPSGSYTFLTGTYADEWKRYENRFVVEAHAVNRLQYRIKFREEFEGWKSMFNFLNRLEIVPQYKIHFSMRKELMGPAETQEDPRDLRQNLQMDYDGDGRIDYTLDDVGANLDTVEAIRDRWDDYARNNQIGLLNAPILRVDYKIAENTKLQGGYQWRRTFDFESSESNYSRHVWLAQVVSKAQWKGYSVTFFLGGKYYWDNYDVNQRDAVLFNGSLYDRKGYEIFAKLFSGI